MGFAEGAVAEARKLLRLWGESRFGPPDILTAGFNEDIEDIEDLDRLEKLCSRLPGARSGQELLVPSLRSSRKGRRWSP